MKRRTFISLILPAAATLSGCGFRPFYFIQMADTQLGMMGGGKDGDDFSQETAILESVISRINRMKPRPSFIAVCGDMTNIPAHEKQVAEYSRLMGLLHRSVRCYNVPGNHDLLGDPPPSHEGIAMYRKFYGPDWYSFTKGGWRFMVMNSTLMKTPESCLEEERAQTVWMDTEFAEESEACRNGTIVFMHHPFFDDNIDEEDGYHAITPGRRAPYLDTFVKGNVKAVFSGHRHTTIPEHTYATIKLINTNAICNSFDNKPGFRLVRMYKNHFEEEFIHGVSIPEKVVL